MALAVLLGGCGITDWVDEMSGRKEIPLPGQRIPVIINEPTLEPDPSVADLRVILPPPVEDANWS